MSAVTFDTLKLAQRLRDEGKFSPEQAEKTAAVLADTFGDWKNNQELATKADINAIKADIAETKVEIIKWVVGFGFAQMAMLPAALKLHF